MLFSLLKQSNLLTGSIVNYALTTIPGDGCVLTTATTNLGT